MGGIVLVIMVGSHIAFHPGMRKKRREGRMKAVTYGVAILLILLWNPAALADYVIKLKNGGKIETQKCWEEKSEIKFQWQGGVGSLPKGNVAGIEKVKEKFPDRTYKEYKEEKEPAPALRDAPIEPQKETNKEGERPSSLGEGFKESDIESYKKQKAQYMGLYEEAYQRYLDATSRHDEEGKQKAWEEFNRFGGRVITLETELKQKNNGVVPQWWKE
jgi:hypothetical protein